MGKSEFNIIQKIYIQYIGVHLSNVFIRQLVLCYPFPCLHRPWAVASFNGLFKQQVQTIISRRQQQGLNPLAYRYACPQLCALPLYQSTSSSSNGFILKCIFSMCCYNMEFFFLLQLTSYQAYVKYHLFLVCSFTEDDNRCFSVYKELQILYGIQNFAYSRAALHEKTGNGLALRRQRQMVEFIISFHYSMTIKPLICKMYF